MSTINLSNSFSVTDVVNWIFPSSPPSLRECTALHEFFTKMQSLLFAKKSDGQTEQPSSLRAYKKIFTIRLPFKEGAKKMLDRLTALYSRLATVHTAHRKLMTSQLRTDHTGRAPLEIIQEKEAPILEELAELEKEKAALFFSLLLNLSDEQLNSPAIVETIEHPGLMNDLLTAGGERLKKKAFAQLAKKLSHLVHTETNRLLSEPDQEILADPKKMRRLITTYPTAVEKITSLLKSKDQRIALLHRDAERLAERQIQLCYPIISHEETTGLPPELLTYIALSFLGDKDRAHLSATCRRLYRLMKTTAHQLTALGIPVQMGNWRGGYLIRQKGKKKLPITLYFGDTIRNLKARLINQCPHLIPEGSTAEATIRNMAITLDTVPLQDEAILDPLSASQINRLAID